MSRTEEENRTTRAGITVAPTDYVEEYNKAWIEEKDRLFKEFRGKRKDKVRWIKNKYYKKAEVPQMYEGVVVGEQELDEKFKTEPECYGKVEISHDEREILRVHPKYTIYKEIDEIECEAEVEKALTKVRWERMKRNNQETNETETSTDTSRSTTNTNANRNTTQHEAENEQGAGTTTNGTRRDTYDIEKKSFDFTVMRGTELPFNAYSHPPAPLENEDEIELQCMKRDLMKVMKEYKANNGEIEMSNLTDSQQKGLKSLRSKQKKNEIVIFQTDKSGKMAVDTPTNYAKAAEPHIEKDTVITRSEFDKIEELTNAHTVCWLRMMKAGEKSNDSHRIKSSMLTHNSDPPTLYVYRKDHKECPDRELGPPVRPVCDVSDSYGHKLSHFLCKILKEVDDEQETTCDSTEDMIAAIEKANAEHNDNERKVVGSMDVKALYPSLDIGFTTEVVCEEFFNSEVEVENVDYAEMGLYLKLNRSDEYIRNSKLEEVCPKRKYRNGKPKITRNGVTVDKEKRWNIWYEPEREPNDVEKRVMLKESLKIALETLMTNHTYKFDEVIRKQKEGGAIGSDLTGEMARIFMCWWDRKIIEKMNQLGIKVLLYKRYVDDINMIIEYLEGSLEYEGGRIVEKERTEESGGEKKDQMMFKIVKDIGNEIHQSIQLTTDTPSENTDGKVPILDLKCWVGEGRDGKIRILYEHYMKSMASRLLVHRQSAMSIQSKRTILTQQCLRVMLNCSEHVDERIRNDHLSYFMARMQSSGYDHEFRLEVLKSAKRAYSKMKEKES